MELDTTWRSIKFGTLMMMMTDDFSPLKYQMLLFWYFSLIYILSVL